jgi:hypothetical protein
MAREGTLGDWWKRAKSGKMRKRIRQTSKV